MAEVMNKVDLDVAGVIEEINGPIAMVKDVRNLKMMEVVKVSKYLLIGEVISVAGDRALIQIYEDTSGVKPGDYVYGTGVPLSVELGPGILSKIYMVFKGPWMRYMSMVFSYLGVLIYRL